AHSAAGSNDILDDDLLAQGSRHVLAYYAGRNIGRTAGGEWHNHGDRAGRKILRPCGLDADTGDGKHSQDERKSHGHTVALHIEPAARLVSGRTHRPVIHSRLGSAWHAPGS